MVGPWFTSPWRLVSESHGAVAWCLLLPDLPCSDQNTTPGCPVPLCHIPLPALTPRPVPWPRATLLARARRTLLCPMHWLLLPAPLCSCFLSLLLTAPRVPIPTPHHPRPYCLTPNPPLSPLPGPCTQFRLPAPLLLLCVYTPPGHQLPCGTGLKTLCFACLPPSSPTTSSLPFRTHHLGPPRPIVCVFLAHLAAAISFARG